MKTTTLYLLAFTGICLVLSPTLPAQQTPERGSPAASGSGAIPPGNLPDEEIITLDPFEVSEEKFGYGATFTLSGARVATKLRDLPRQVNVITSELTLDTNSTTVEDAVLYVSSTDFTDHNNTDGTAKVEDAVANLRLRGFKVSTLYRNFSPTQSMPWGPFLDRIEVVKGPASTLYGRAAPGGLVNVITKRPQFIDKTVASATIGIVEVRTFRGLIDHQGTLDVFNRPLGYRISAGVQFKEGPKQNTPDDRHGLLVSLDWQATDRDTLIFELESANERGLSATSVHWKTPIGVSRQLAFRSYPDDRTFNPRPTYDFEEVWTDKIFVEYRRQLSDNINIQLTYEFGQRDYEAQFSSFPGIRRAVEVFGGASNYNNVTDEVLVEYQRRSQTHITNGFNGNLFAKFGPEMFRNELLIGGNIYDEDFSLFTESVAAPRVTRSGLKFFPPAQVLLTTTALEDFDYPGKATAEPDEDNNNLPDFTWVLGEDTERVFRNQAFHVTNTAVLLNNRIRLMAGTRYDHMEQGQDSLRLIQTKQGDIASRDVQQKGSQNIWTIQLAAMVNVRKNIGYYISKAESAVQQFLAVRERNTPPALAVPASPLIGVGWETGFKFSMFKEKLNGTIAYFQSVEENRVNNSGTDRFGAYQRVAKSNEVEGVEIDWVFQPNSRWQTIIFGAYMKAMENILDPTDPKFDRFGPISDVPQWQGGFFTKYSFEEGPLHGFEVGLGMEGVDDSRTEPPVGGGGAIPSKNRENLKQYWVFDVMAAYEWTWGEKDWRLQLNIDNLFDRRYFVGGSSYGLLRWGEVTVTVEF